MKLSILYEGFNLWNGQPRYSNDLLLHHIMCEHREELSRIIKNPQHSRISGLRNIIGSMLNDIDDITIDSDEDQEMINTIKNLEIDIIYQLQDLPDDLIHNNILLLVRELYDLINKYIREFTYDKFNR